MGGDEARRDRWWATARARGIDLGLMFVAAVLGGIATDGARIDSVAYAELNDLVGVAAIAVLWWRRRYPIVVTVLTFLAAAVAPLAGGASIVSVYTVGAERPRRVALAVAALHVAPTVVVTIVAPDQDLSRLENALFGSLFTLTALGWGLATRSQRALLASLAERAERAEAEQLARVAEARQAERTRIAGEMHDVLAHRLSMLSLQAGAIELRPGAAPEDLARAAGVIRSGAHLALDELRAVIGVLREDGGTGVAPPPTVADVADLVEECRAAGMAIQVLDPPFDADAVPPELGRHAYRVVQEGLTNARKHAPGAPVRLALTGGAGDGLCVEVVNRGAAPGRDAAPGAAPTPGPDAVPGAGLGLVGLRERVGVVGGRLDHGTDAAGTHRLHAWLPWPA